MILLAALYTLIIILIALFGIQRFLLTISALKTVQSKDAVLPDNIELPHITVQLPVYNERHVVKRLVDAICNLDYPRAKLQIQVLDDSDDETSELIAVRVHHWQEQGLDITHIQRDIREEYKPGALASGLRQAKGEYIAIFDADFVPQQDWLLKALAHFYQPNTDRLGLLQTRWGHLNSDDSILTMAQALILDDGATQQTLRSGQELFIIFNGTAGLWKRACIEESGGWSGQSLSEDTDLAYRAQLKGWELQYDNQVRSMAEIPATMLDYKLQQSRWTRGTLQLARLLLKKLINSPIRSRQKLDAITFIFSPVIYLLVVIFILCRISLIFYPSDYIAFLDVLMLIGFVGIIAPLVLSWFRHRYAVFPWNLLLLSGTSLHNTIYFVTGLIGPLGGEFKRTPKQGADHQFNNIVSYHPDKFLIITALELLFALYIISGVILSIVHGQFFILPILLVCLSGYLWVVGQSLFEIYCLS